MLRGLPKVSPSATQYSSHRTVDWNMRFPNNAWCAPKFLHMGSAFLGSLKNKVNLYALIENIPEKGHDLPLY